MQRIIHHFERNEFTCRRILPADPREGIRAREFRADFARQHSTGLLVFSILIDTDGNVTTPNQTPTE